MQPHPTQLYSPLSTLVCIIMGRYCQFGRSEERTKASVYDVKNSAQIPLDLQILFSFPWIPQTRLGQGLPKKGALLQNFTDSFLLIPMVLKSCLQTFKDLQVFA